VKEMLNGRQEKLALYQNATKQLETKKEKLEKAKGSVTKQDIEESEKKKLKNIANNLQRFQILVGKS